MNKDTKDLLKRFLVFLVILTIGSSLIFKSVTDLGLLYPFSFYFYGNLGKVALLGIVLLILQLKKHLYDITFLKARWNFFYLVLSVILLGIIYYLINNGLTYLLVPSEDLILYLYIHLALISLPIIVALGVVDIEFLKNTITTYKKQLLLSTLVSILCFFGIFWLWDLWPFFSKGVTLVVFSILVFFTKNIEYFPPRTLFLDNFFVEIDKACSGVESLFLFSVLFLFMALIDRKELTGFKAIGVYILGIFLLYLVNIMRVLLIVIIGAKISPDLAMGLFHSYAGMILFLIYFFLFTKLVYLRIKK